MPCYSRATAGDLWRESRNLLVARTAGAVGSNLEVPLAAMVASPAASTVLALTGKVMTVVMMMTERIGSAVFAGLAYISGRPSAQRDQVMGEIVNISTVLSGIGLACALVFSKPIITLWVGPELFGGNWLVILIMVSCLMSIRMRLYSNLAMALGEIRLVAGWMIVEALMRLALLVGLGLLLKVFGLPLANAIVSAMIMTILGQLLIHRLRVRVPVVWLPGWPSLAVAMSVAVAWMLLIPVAQTWTELTWQAGIFAALVLFLSVAIDSQWRVTLRRNYYALTWALSRKPT
jgi:O-antigen/teichoic acid export membrane protein